MFRLSIKGELLKYWGLKFDYHKFDDQNFDEHFCHLSEVMTAQLTSYHNALQGLPNMEAVILGSLQLNMAFGTAKKLLLENPQFAISSSDCLNATLMLQLQAHNIESLKRLLGVPSAKEIESFWKSSMECFDSLVGKVSPIDSEL